MKKDDKNKNEGLGCCIVLLIIVAMIFIPIIVNSIEGSNKAKHEATLIEEGKTKSADTIIDEVIETLKNKDEEKIKKYLADDFTYIDNNSYESKYVSNFFEDLKYLVTSYDIEKRGNSIKDEATYFIYWNTNEMVKERTDSLYCLQKLKIYLKRTIETDEITYKVYKIILTDN